MLINKPDVLRGHLQSHIFKEVPSATCSEFLCISDAYSQCVYRLSIETSETEITTTEIIKRRDVGPYGIRSEYCIRKIICPIGVPEAPKGKK